jgi:hypothetical protein
VRGVRKHDKKIPQISRTLVLFWPLTHPPTTGVTEKKLPAPWVAVLLAESVWLCFSRA